MLNLYCKKKKKKKSQPTPSIIPHPRLFGAPGHLT